MPPSNDRRVSDCALDVDRSSLLAACLAGLWYELRAAVTAGLAGPDADEHVARRTGLPLDTVVVRLALADRILRGRFDGATLLSRLGVLRTVAAAPGDAGPDRLAATIAAAAADLGALSGELAGAAGGEQLPPRWPVLVPVEDVLDAAAVLAVAAHLLELVITDCLESLSPAGGNAAAVADLCTAEQRLRRLWHDLEVVGSADASLGSPAAHRERDEWLRRSDPGGVDGHDEADGGDTGDVRTATVGRSVPAVTVARGGDVIADELASSDDELRVRIAGVDGTTLSLTFSARRRVGCLAAVDVWIAAASGESVRRYRLATPLAAVVGGAWSAGYTTPDGALNGVVEVSRPEWLPIEALQIDDLHDALEAFTPSPSAQRAWRALEANLGVSASARSMIGSARRRPARG